MRHIVSAELCHAKFRSTALAEMFGCTGILACLSDPTSTVRPVYRGFQRWVHSAVSSSRSSQKVLDDAVDSTPSKKSMATADIAHLNSEPHGVNFASRHLPRGSSVNVAINKKITSSRRGEEILQVVTQHASNMNSVNVATAWHRLAKLSRSFPTSSCQEIRQKRQIIHDVRMQIMERLLDKFADTFDAMNLSNVAWSCAVLDYHPSGSILSRVYKNIAQRTREGLSHARYPVDEVKAFPSAQSLSNCLWAFTTLRHALAPKLAALCAETMPFLLHQFNPRAAGVGGAFVTQTVANQLWAFASLRHHPGDALMDSFANIVAHHASHFKPQEISNVTWSYAVLSHYPGDQFLRTVEHEMSSRPGRFSPQGLTNNVFSMASFQRSDAAARAGLCSFMHSLDDELTLQQIEHFNVQDLSNSIWGISVLGGFNLKFYYRLWERLACFDFSNIDRDGILMIYQGRLLMESVAPGLSDQIPAPKWLWTEAKQKWREQAGTGTVSSYQREVSCVLSDMEVGHEVERKTSDMMMSMDLGLDLQSITLECDGPSHFCVNLEVGSVPLSRNNVRDTLLSSRGWHVISLPWDEWAVKEGREESADWIKRKLAHISDT